MTLSKGAVPRWSCDETPVSATGARVMWGDVLPSKAADWHAWAVAILIIRFLIFTCFSEETACSWLIRQTKATLTHVQLSTVRCSYPPDEVGRKHQLLDLQSYVEFKTNLKQLFSLFSLSITDFTYRQHMPLLFTLNSSWCVLMVHYQWKSERECVHRYTPTKLFAEPDGEAFWCHCTKTIKFDWESRGDGFCWTLCFVNERTKCHRASWIWNSRACIYLDIRNTDESCQRLNECGIFNLV